MLLSMLETEEKRDQEEVKPEAEEKPTEDTGGADREQPEEKPEEKPDDKDDSGTDEPGDSGGSVGGPEEPDRPEKTEKPGDDGDRPSGFPDTDLGLGIVETTDEYEERRQKERERDRDREMDRERERRAKEAKESPTEEETEEKTSTSTDSEKSSNNPIYEAIAPYYSEDGTEKFEIDKPTIESFIDWCCADNRFLGYNDKNDLKKNKDLGIEGAPKTDKIANEVTGFVFSRLISTGVGAALISTGVLAWLGIIIIAFGNTPNCIMSKIREYFTDKTFGIIPFSDIPNITEKMADHAEGAQDRIKEREAEMKKYTDLAKSKSSVVRLGNLIRDFGRYLPYSKIQDAIANLKDLQSKVLLNKINGPEISQNFSQLFSKILSDFTKGKDKINQEFQAVNEFLNKNNEGVPIFSNGFGILIDSFTSLLSLKHEEDDITRGDASSPKNNEKNEANDNAEDETKKDENESDTDKKVDKDDEHGSNDAADKSKDDLDDKKTEIDGPTTSTKSEADKDEKLDAAKSKMEAVTDSKEDKRPTSNREKVRQMEKDRGDFRSQ